MIMKFQRTIRGSQSRLSLALLTLTLTNVALAQPGDEPAKAEASVGNASSTTEAPNAATNGNANATTEKPEASRAVAVTPVPDKPASVPVAAPAIEPAPPTSIPLSVEILPGSGYPEPRVRGIVGGSLWLTMHGHQFPYMGPETSKETARIAISGSVWDDTSYVRIKSGDPNYGSMKRWTNQARAVLRATPTYTTRDGWFAQGQLEFVANGDQTLGSSQNIGGVDDAFVRAGKWKLFDITAGRFQGWEVYHYGMGLDQNTFERSGAYRPGSQMPAQIYGASYYWDRPDAGAGNYAAHVYFTDYLRLEVLGQIGSESGSGKNTRAVRPVAILDLGFLKAKVGAEYGVAKHQQDGNQSHSKKSGIGGALQFVANPYIEGGINGAIGYIDEWDQDGLPLLRQSKTNKSVGGFLNGRIVGPMLVGAGLNYSYENDLDQNSNTASPNYGKPNYKTHTQGFGAIQYSFWDKLSFKFVLAYAAFHYGDIRKDPPTPFDTTAWSGRFRMMYLF
jgi:hypothetical protein